MEHSGNWGVIAGVSHLREWTINEGFTSNKMVASNSQNGTNRTKGVYDWTGQFSAFGAVPPYWPGSFFSGDFYKTPSPTGVTATGDKLAGSVYVQQVAITWDYKTNAPISYVCQFGGNGDLTFTTGAFTADAASMVEQPPCMGKVTVYNGTTESTIQHVTQAVLTLTREAKISVNSGTTTGANKCNTQRRAGAALDWTLALTTEDGNENSLITSGTVTELRLYYDATNYYQLKWGIFEGRTNIKVNRENADIVGQTHNAAMKAFNAGSAGTVKAGATVVWP